MRASNPDNMAFNGAAVFKAGCGHVMGDGFHEACDGSDFVHINCPSGAGALGCACRNERKVIRVAVVTRITSDGAIGWLRIDI